ncbi:protein FAM83H isoform X2 [Toxotes jaculatrix]|uniref:protein FAM83H isoform X2 n=1 Tax=Toxotes jaculatrix TaxID=941984 RepID=UPI001B3B05F7|nr:protein FAM83H isoform X2 [Toxotes jaculatrix]
MARRSQCSSAGDNPLDPNYLPPHYREEYRIAIDALVEEDLEGYYKFLQRADVVDFLSTPEIQYIQSSVQVPQQGHHPEQHFLETGGDGSSDTYWPIHSDLDVPGLDLGWPQLHHFIGPTEVTTLVNPPEPDMPSIKEQARRLIKNAQQVVAVVMDMFTDVDIFAELLNAAMRSVAVYILLDEQNADHFVNMVSNCRVNLQSIQFLRVRTVSGITYHCRSGKSFKGQMMDRFLLTDCRAVLSGNYSFMWSFEKLHRCMAHLFLGQLVSTFDEEFRILFAQSQPLLIENALAPLEDFGLSQKTQYPSDRTSLFRDTRKFLSLDTGHPEDRARHPYDERMDVDWRMMPLKRQGSLHGPSDMYSRFPSQQARMDPSFDQLPSRISIMENPAFKRHSYAEGGHGRLSYPFLQQQAMPEPENQGRHFLRGQLPYPYPGPGPEADYGGYDKIWSQDCHSADQYSEHGLPQEMQPSDNFNPVLNYLSSTRNVDFDQSSEKLLSADLPFSSSHPRRLSLGQPYACQTSPTPSAPTDQKHFFQDPSTDRKDPTVKRGLRNWRISSYLSAYDNPGDEGLPLAPPQAQDHFEEPLHPTQQTAPGIDLSVPKIPNVREFKIPAVPRASQMPGYTKTTVQDQPKKLLDEPAAVAAETKTTPTPSESSSTTEGEKVEEVEQKEPKTTVLRREESFRRKYNAAVPRSSRLRSSLIFSSLDQQNASQDAKTAPGQQDEESDKNEAEPAKLPFVAQVLAQRRSAAREPFEWSRYIKSATETSRSDDGSSKADDKDPSKEENSKDLSENLGVEGSSKPPGVEQTNSSPSLPRSKPSEAELPKTDSTIQAPKPLLNTPSYVDMNDPDKRLMFFKELAAKRKAAKAAETEKSKDKAPMKPPTDLKNSAAVKKEEPDPKEVSEKMADTSPSEGLAKKFFTADVAGKTVATEASESASLSLEASDKTNKQDSLAKNDPSTSQSCKEEQTRLSNDSEKKELKTSQSETSLPVSSETKSQTVEPPGDLNLSKPAVKESSPSHPPTPTNAPPDNVPSPAQGTDESESPNHDSTSKESSSVTPISVEVPLSSHGALDSNTQNPESAPLETRISEPAAPSEQQTGSDLSSSNASVQSSSPDQILSDSGSQISPSPLTSSSAPLSTPGETLSSNVTPEDSSLFPSSSIVSPDSDKPEAQDSVSPSSPESSQAIDEISTESESAQAHLDQLASSETASTADSAHVESNLSHDVCGASAESNESSLQSTTKTNSEESCAPTPSEKDVSESENNSLPEAIAKESEVLGSSKDVKADSTPPCLSPSSPKSSLPDVSYLENSASRPDQTETVNLHAPPEHTPSETCSPLSTDVTPNSPQSATTASPQDTLTQATPPSELNLTGSVTLTPVETVSCFSPLTESVGSVLSLEAEKTETNMSTLCIPSDAPSPPEEITTDSDKNPVLPSTEASSPTEPTSKIPTEPDVPCKTPESVTSESQPSEPPVLPKNSNIDHQTEANKEPEIPNPAEKKPEDTEATNKVNKSTTQESVSSEKTNDLVRQNSCSESAEITSDEAVPLSPQSKQPKSSQSRYHSSTANVLSSSNLRDDTKLLLEQISAHSQSRNEATKESPVTDDEKEDKQDKNAKREKERGMRSLGRVQPKSTQEKEKLLERIQSMRKEKKVYSRFEV